MDCLNPTFIKSPETRLLAKCRKEGKSFEYYYHHANVRRNLLLDPVPLVNEPYDYYHIPTHPEQRVQRVPCGKCDNCLKRKVNDYFVRTYFEYVDTLECGSSWFLTLTFADSLLPHYNGHACFDSEYIKLFMKRLRILLQRKLGYYGEVRYFIVSEYGGEFGRPHHHGTLHLKNYGSKNIDLIRLKGIVAHAWTRLSDRDNWYSNDEIDLFDCQRVDVQKLESAAQCRYVAKYVGKQLGCEDFDSLVKEYRYKRNHWQSLGYGDCLTKYVDSVDFQNGIVRINGFKYAVPFGLSVKLKREFFCYEDNGDIIYQPTAFARDSARDFTFNKLEEYKKLSLINTKFPKCPSILNDPFALASLYDYLDRYSGFYQSFDLSNDDFINSTLLDKNITSIVYAVNEYFQQVDDFYQEKYKASAYKWREHQKNRYLKKKFLK